MPKKAKELTSLAVKALKEDGRHAVGGVDGLYLRIVGNSRAWVLRIKVDGRRADVGLGSYPDIGLADAREAAREFRRKARLGINPLAEKRERAAAAKSEKVKAKTFEECAAAYVEAHKEGWKNAKHEKQFSATLNTYAAPVIGKMIIAKVDTNHVIEILKPLWATKTETASRLRGRIEAVLDWAKVAGYRDGDNPARWRGHLSNLLPPKSKVAKVKHHEALPYAQMGVFMAELRNRKGISARALEFAILCAARSNEVRGATWEEFDLNQAHWTIPKERMKANKEHRVPLSAASLALLREIAVVDGSPFVFPAPRGGPLSDMALTAVLKRMDYPKLTQHGFRSSFRDWAGETTAYPREVIEHALAHQLRDKAEAAYQRGSLFAKRSRLMADWSAYCGQPSGSDVNVIAMQGVS